MPVQSRSRFERFFRAAASLDVDKNDLKRYQEFLDNKIYDLFLIAKGRRRRPTGGDVIQPTVTHHEGAPGEHP